MVAVPTLAGAVLRIVNGLLGDRIGQKRTGTLNQLIVMAGLLAGWWYGIDSFAGTIAIGVILGFVGLKMLAIGDPLNIHLPTYVSLGFIAVVLTVSILASIRADRKHPHIATPDLDPEPEVSSAPASAPPEDEHGGTG